MHRNARKPPVSAWPAPAKSPTRLPPSQGVPLPAFEEPTVDADIQLISDGDGLAVIGNPTAVDLFLAAERLASKDLRSEEHTSELQSRQYLVCRLLLEKKKHRH